MLLLKLIYLLFLLGWFGDKHEDHIAHDAENVSKVVVGPVQVEGSVQGQHDKGRHHVFHHQRRHENAGHAVQTPLGRRKTRREFFAGHAFGHGHEGHGQEEQVVSGIKSVPKGTRHVHGKEIAIGTVIDITGQPQRRLFVPGLAEGLGVGSRFEFPNVHVARVFPTEGVALFVKSLKAGVPHIVGTLGVHPTKVILGTDREQESEPGVGVTDHPRFGQKGCRQDHRGVFLRIGRIEERDLAAESDKDPQTGQTDQKGFEGGQKVAGDLALGFAVLVVQETAVAGRLVGGKLRGGSGQDVGEAKGVSEVLNEVGEAR